MRAHRDEWLRHCAETLAEPRRSRHPDAVPSENRSDRSLSDHPGYLGLTSEGVIAIHADWPSYPIEHGWLTALINLCSFPHETKFTEIDDIDRCLLLSAEDLAPDDAGDDLVSPRRYHAAVWHNDLIELGRLGYVTGVEAITDRVHELNHWLEIARAVERAKGEDGDPSSVPPPYRTWPSDGPPDLPKLYYVKPNDGTVAEVPLPDWEEYEDDEEFAIFPEPAGCVLLPDKTLAVTPAGWRAAEKALAEHFEIPDALRARLNPLLDAGLYEVAVREASVQLEVAMRDGIQVLASGQKLVERYCRYLEDDLSLIASGIKTLRGELRLTFKFVRNEYAHSNPDPSRVRALSLLHRLCALHTEITELTPGAQAQTP
jgi:hypothetical protein